MILKNIIVEKWNLSEPCTRLNFVIPTDIRDNYGTLNVRIQKNWKLKSTNLELFLKNECNLSV